ncbi:MAG: hypothetical protein WBO47_03530 [Gammaproteobacteria bacterium]
MKQFAEWVVGREYRAGLVAAALALIPLLGIIGSGVLVLATLKRGPAAGWGAAAVATAVLLVASWIGGATPLSAMIAALVLWAPAVGLATLLRGTGSLSMCAQMATVGGLLAAGFLIASLDQSGGGWSGRLLQELQPLMAETGAGDEMLQVMLGILPGALAASLMLAALLGLFVGMSLHASLAGSGAFAIAFRSLRLGRVLAGLAVVLLVLVIASGQLAFASLLTVAVAALALQGLGAVHDMAARRQWPAGVIAVVYLVLIFMMGFAAPLLAAIGLADNWIDFRGRGETSAR